MMSSTQYKMIHKKVQLQAESLAEVVVSSLSLFTAEVIVVDGVSVVVEFSCSSLG